MDDAGQDLVNSITDPVKGAWKKVNDLADKIPSFGVKPVSDSKPNQVDPADVQKANDSFRYAAQTKAQSRPAVAPKVQVKSSVKVTPRKR